MVESFINIIIRVHEYMPILVCIWSGSYENTYLQCKVHMSIVFYKFAFSLPKKSINVQQQQIQEMFCNCNFAVQIALYCTAPPSFGLLVSH